MSVTAFIQHRVKDYDSWRQAYDGVADMQRENGVTAESVHHATDDPNDVMVTHRFETLDEAEAFFAMPDLREVMQEAGVEGAPRIEIYEDA